jgi:hypothetical protein
MLCRVTFFLTEKCNMSSSRVCVSISVDHRARASFARNEYIVVGSSLLLLLLLLLLVHSVDIVMSSADFILIGRWSDSMRRGRNQGTRSSMCV